MLFAGLEVALRLDGGHAAGAGGGDRLAEMGVLHVSGGEDAGGAGRRPLAGDDA